MLTKLAKIKEHYDNLSAALSAPDAMEDRAVWLEKTREHANLSEIVAAYEDYSRDTRHLADAKGMLNEHLDAEMKELVQMEIAELEECSLRSIYKSVQSVTKKIEKTLKNFSREG